MTIKNTFCELKDLTSSQVRHLQMLMPDTEHFDFFRNEGLIGFEDGGDAGTWGIDSIREKGIVSYKDMLSFLGGEGEDFLKGVISGVKFTDHNNPDNSFEHNFEDKKLTPHIHQKEIIAWAKGEDIEVESMFDKGSWFLTKTPLWRKRCQYRVKEGLSSTQILIAEKEKELSLLKYQDAVERGVNIVLGEVDES
jgi:hypothetical protein